MLISRTDCQLLIVDIQEKLASAIHDNDTVTRNAVRLLEAARLLTVPAFVSEQYVKGLGPSLPAIRAAASAAPLRNHHSAVSPDGREIFGTSTWIAPACTGGVEVSVVTPVLAQPLVARVMAKARLKLVGRMAGSVRIARL